MEKYIVKKRKNILDEFRVSGMSKCAFAVAKGILKTTFSGWVKSDRINTFGEIDLNSSSKKINNIDIKYMFLSIVYYLKYCKMQFLNNL